MAINITADPLVFTPTISGSWLEVTIFSEPLVFTPNLWGVTTFVVPAVRNPDLDVNFDCLGYDRFDEANQGVLSFDPGISGTWLNLRLVTDTLSFDPTISGTYISGILITDTTLAFSTGISTDAIFEMPANSWIQWSKIGYFDFTQDHKNQAGKRPMEWAGLVYDILKFKNSVIVYGANGISEMKPVKNTWSLRNISALGTKGKQAQISNKSNNTHWYVNILGELWELGDKITKLDYSEFLSSLTSPVLTINEKDNLLYICDGSTGYTYSYIDKSLGQSAGNITGYGYKDGVEYPVSTSAVVQPTVAFTTDVYDMGTRKNKTIFNVELHTNTAQTMQVAINYRMDYTSEFVQTPWATVNPSGFAYLPCYGIEFQFKFKMETYADFNIDQMKINGVIHGFSFLDTVRKEN